MIVHVSFLGTPLEAGKSYLAVENRMVAVGGRGERKGERNGGEEGHSERCSGHTTFHCV